MTTTPSRMFQRRRTAAQWAAENPVLAAGEVGVSTGGAAPGIKIGDGTTAWNSLDGIILPEILTGVITAPATFAGIEREARFFPSGSMMSPTAQINFGDGFPRLNMAKDVTTDAYMIFEVEEWWLDQTIGVYFEWVNDHTTTGDVRWDCDVKEVDIGTQTLAAATTLVSRTFTQASDSANEALTSIVGSVANGNAITLVRNSPLASFYVLRVSRLGADAADTLAGPVGLLAASMTRGQ